MSILSSICRVPVVLPPSSSAAVVSGSAMLGRYAAEVRDVLGGKEITSMDQAKEAGKEMKERLWEIMVRPPLLPPLAVAQFALCFDR
jgi:hypothetical protein